MLSWKGHCKLTLILRAARSPVFYGSSRISGRFSRLPFEINTGDVFSRILTAVNFVALCWRVHTRDACALHAGCMQAACVLQEACMQGACISSVNPPSIMRAACCALLHPAYRRTQAAYGRNTSEMQAAFGKIRSAF